MAKYVCMKSVVAIQHASELARQDNNDDNKHINNNNDINKHHNDQSTVISPVNSNPELAIPNRPIVLL